MQCIGRTQSGARCKNDARFITCTKHSWQPLTAGITSIAITAGLFQDVAKPIYERLTQPAPPSTSWYVGSWQIDVERTLASIPVEAGFSAEWLNSFRSSLARAKVEIGPTGGRIQGPGGSYSREQRGAQITELELRSIVDFTISPRSDDFAVPTLIQPTGARIATGTATMSGIHRTSDGIFIEGDGVTMRHSMQINDGTQRNPEWITEKAYVMRMYLVRTPTASTVSSKPGQ